MRNNTKNLKRTAYDNNTNRNLWFRYTISQIWASSEKWDNYNSECLKAAGYKEKMQPYRSGSNLYRPDAIPDNNLEILIEKHLEELEEAKKELITFGKRLNNINIKRKAPVHTIDKLLIWKHR